MALGESEGGEGARKEYEGKGEGACMGNVGRAELVAGALNTWI
jgi:hypothetical protein